MALETATNIEGLVAANPASGDPRSQGDDHLRMIKTVLKNSFPNLSGKFGAISTQGANYTALAVDTLKVFDFSAAATLDLTAAATLTAGWSCWIVARGGAVTIEPNGAELINGETNIVIPKGWAGYLVCSAVASNEFFFFVSRISATVDAVTDISGNTTLDAGDAGKFYTISATAEVELPAAATFGIGNTLEFKSLTTGNAVLDPNSTETMDGSTSSFRLPAYESVKIRAVTGGWIIVQKPASFIGELRPMASANLPVGWLAADFAAVSRTTYAGYFAEVGTVHGAGDGSTTVNVPDTRGRNLIGDGTGAVHEDVDAAQVTDVGDSFTVASNTAKWVTGMMVQLTTTGGLPTGLSAATDYWIIRINATTIKLASTLANAQNGTVQTFSSQGTGVHTLTHVLTARTAGERLGEAAHADSSTEQLAHTHTQTAHTHQQRTSNAVHTAKDWYLSQIGGGASTSTGSNTRANDGSVDNGSALNTASTTAVNQSTGGNVAANNMQPGLVAKYMVKV